MITDKWNKKSTLDCQSAIVQAHFRFVRQSELQTHSHSSMEHLFKKITFRGGELLVLYYTGPVLGIIA